MWNWPATWAWIRTRWQARKGVEILAGNRVAEGSEPLALAYAGHQFGHFVPQLGDGRANLLGEVLGRDGVRYDIQLKGSGPTPFSRGGDGRAALGPVLREYIVSEAMAALGVPTTRALAAVTTGEQVLRETALPGAVLTRVAASHLRVGTFQYFAARGDTEGTRTLADYAIARHYPEAAQAKQPYRALLDGVIARQARLVAQWMLLGFIHGVMNTDNTSISGETIDYGPCAFMEAYDPPRCSAPSTITDAMPMATNPRRTGTWRVSPRHCCPFWSRRQETRRPRWPRPTRRSPPSLRSSRRLTPPACAASLASSRSARAMRRWLRTCSSAWPRTGRLHPDLPPAVRCRGGPEGDEGVRALFADPGAYDAWAVGWRRRLEEEPVSGQARAAAMRMAIRHSSRATTWWRRRSMPPSERQDFQPFEELLDVVSRPYEDRPGLERYATPARPEECVSQTFCGT
jgi:uncharacterized protein YdiU (UPF0061 family)